MGKHNITVEDSSPLLVFTGNWADSPNGAPDYDKYSGYAKPEFSSVHKSNGTAKVEFTFNGSAVYVFGSQSPIGGGYLVSLDSEDNTERDTAKNSTKVQGSDTIYQALLYSWQTKTHSRSPRKLDIDVLGDGEFALDYIVVESEQADEKDTSQVREITLDDTSPAFEYSGGSWNATQVQNNQTNIVTKFFENGTEHTVADVGGTVALKFRGTGAQVHGVWYLGSFQASLDGGQPTTIESHLGNPEGLYNRPRELLYMTDGLTEDDHTVVFTNKGFDDGHLQNPYFSIDYAIISTIDPANTNGTHTGAGALNTTTTPNQGNTASHSMSFSLNTALTALVFMWLMRFWRS